MVNEWYKVLKNNKSKDGGSFDYTAYLPKNNKPGKWTPRIKDCIICSRGYHLTKDINEFVMGGNQVFLAVPKNIILVEDSKCVCDSIRLIKLVETNTGKGNSGLMNSGDRNSGYWNSGDRNSGYWNSGDRNSGNGNSGDRNSGDRNSGNWNSGYWNSGDRNSGDRNSGNWNSCDDESGHFNTKTSETIRVFNKKCSRKKWYKTIKPSFIHFNLNEWIPISEMTEKEKKEHPRHKTTGGYLKTLDYKTAFKERFREASEEDVKLLITLPNFDYQTFEELSGITKEMIQDKIKKRGES
jgi:hypothetical protein